MASHQVGAALSASFAGFLRTTEGNYDHAFLFAGLLCIFAALGVLFAARPAMKPALNPVVG